MTNPQKDADGWIRWDGGECPIEGRVKHQVKFGDGAVSSADDSPGSWSWHCGGESWDIVAYRVIE